METTNQGHSIDSIPLEKEFISNQFRKPCTTQPVRENKNYGQEVWLTSEGTERHIVQLILWGYTVVCPCNIIPLHEGQTKETNGTFNYP